MKRSPLLLTLLILITLALPCPAQDETPPIDQWIKELQNGDDRQRRNAAYQLDNLGLAAEPAIPALIKALDDNQQQVWFHSLMALSQLGPAAKDAVPRLMKGLEQGNSRRRRNDGPSQTWYRSAYALGKIGPPAVPSLTEALKSDNNNVRAGATKALSWVQPQPTNVIPALIKNLNDPDDTVRRYTSECLGGFESAALPALKQALANPETQTGAAVAIGWIGPKAIDAAPNLAEALTQSDDAETKGECINALSRLRYDPTKFTPILFDSLHTEDKELRQAVMNALLLIRPAQQHTVPRLTTLLQAPERADQELAARLLGRLGEDASAATPQLIQLAQASTNDSTRSIYTEALTRIGTPAIPGLLHHAESQTDIQPGHWIISAISNIGEPAVSHLIHALDDASPAAQHTIAIILKEMGPQAKSAARPLAQLIASPKPALQASAISTLIAIDADLIPLLPELEEELSNGSPLVRKTVADAAAKIGPRAKLLATALKDSISDPDPGVRASSALALASILPEEAETITLLTQAITDSDPSVQIAATQSLGNLGPGAAQATPNLIKAASSGSNPLRAQAIDTLGKIGSAADQALPAIEKALTDPDPSVRSSAVRAFRLVQTDPAKVLPALKNALQDRESAVRLAAIETLGKLGRDARPATSELFSLLDKDEDRAVTLEALPRIRINSLPHLIDALDHTDSSVRIYACNALGRLGSDARDAIPALKKRFDDSYDQVAREAREAVRRIER